jgi:hypothetical protein
MSKTNFLQIAPHIYYCTGRKSKTMFYWLIHFYGMTILCDYLFLGLLDFCIVFNEKVARNLVILG